MESADETAAKVREAGGAVLMEPFDIFDSGRMAWFTDPEGAGFGVWQPNQHRGATVVNEPGSLNFNGLHSRDEEGAKAFYGAVFGWELLPMGMWALPAYGDHLEALNPGTKERTREMGGPTRFEEVVAAFSVITDDHAAALGRHVRRRRRRRDRRARGGARRDGGRAAVRRAVDPRDRHPRPRRRDVQREPVHAREQGHGDPGGRHVHRVMSARSAVAVSRSTTVSSGRPRPL